MSNGKYHLRAPNGRPVKYPRAVCSSKRSRYAKEAVPYKSFGHIKVADRCKLCNAIYKRLKRSK